MSISVEGKPVLDHTQRGVNCGKPAGVLALGEPPTTWPGRRTSAWMPPSGMSSQGGVTVRSRS